MPVTGQDVEDGVFSWDSWKPTLPKIKWPQFRKQPELQELSPDFKRASEFAALFQKDGPAVAYSKFGANDINSLFDAAVKYGLLDPGDRQESWNEANNQQPVSTPGMSGGMQPANPAGSITMDSIAGSKPVEAGPATITADMMKKAGGYRNALEQQWLNKNYIEPDRSQYRDTSKYRADYAEWYDYTNPPGLPMPNPLVKR